MAWAAREIFTHHNDESPVGVIAPDVELAFPELVREVEVRGAEKAHQKSKEEVIHFEKYTFHIIALFFGDWNTPRPDKNLRLWP